MRVRKILRDLVCRQMVIGVKMKYSLVISAISVVACFTIFSTACSKQVTVEGELLVKVELKNGK
jgi:hypothetical protein